MGVSSLPDEPSFAKSTRASPIHDKTTQSSEEDQGTVLVAEAGFKSTNSGLCDRLFVGAWWQAECLLFSILYWQSESSA